MKLPSIVIAEDETELRKLLVSALEDFGFLALEAGDGAEALLLCKANPSISLLLSDVRMPKMDGYALAEQAITYNDNLKVLMMTGYPTDHPPPAVLRAREVRTLRKPFDIAKMCELVSDMLGRP